MKNKGLLITLSCIFLFLIVLSFRILPLFVVEEIKVDGFCIPYNLQYELKLLEGRSLLLISERKIKKRMESYGFLEKVSFSFHDNCLTVKGEAFPEAVIITDGTLAYLYNGAYKSLGIEDVPVLSESFSLVHISPDFLQYCEKYGFPENFTKLMSALGAAKASSALITIADYDNNKGSIYTGTLRVKLPDVEAELQINDFRDNEMVHQAIEIIRNEYYSSRNRLDGVVQAYELSNGQLVRKKR